jgi:hypothetical protein
MLMLLVKLVGRNGGFGNDAAYEVPMAALFVATGCAVWLVASRSLKRHRNE